MTVVVVLSLSSSDSSIKYAHIFRERSIEEVIYIIKQYGGGALGVGYSHLAERSLLTVTFGVRFPHWSNTDSCYCAQNQ